MDAMEVEATITKRGQTTVPSSIRKVLRVSATETKIVYRVLADGSVVLSKKEGPGDPLIAAFLAFLETDTRKNLGSLQPVTPEWLSGVQTLVKGVEVDLDAALSEDDE